MPYFESTYTPSPEELQDPGYAFENGRDFAERFAVTADPLTDPSGYYEQMRTVNPRKPKDGGPSLVRYELENSTTKWSDADKDLIGHTAERLGILVQDYPFRNGEEHGDVLVAEGARNATLDRTVATLEAVKEGRLYTPGGLWVAGSGRVLNEKERAAVADWAPDAHTGFDIADAVVERLRAEYAEVLADAGADGAPLSLQAFRVEAPKPNQRTVTQEFIDRRRAAGARVGRFVTVTTALYVPFKTHLGLAAAKPRDVVAVARGVESRAEVVAARTVDTYVAEVAQTLASAAAHQQVILEMAA
jgi:hypothetical protein